MTWPEAVYYIGIAWAISYTITEIVIAANKIEKEEEKTNDNN